MILLLLLQLTALSTSADSNLANQLVASKDFESLQAAFNSGKYEDALQQLRAHPEDAATYYYDLGTVLLKLNRIGEATAYLEKANHLQPRDIAIQQNLQLAQNSLAKTVGAEHLDPASSWTENLADRLRLDEIRGAFGLVCFVIALFWIRSYLKTRKLRQTLMKPAGWLGIGALALTAALYGMERLSGMNPVVVCLEHASVRSGPGDSYVEVSQAEAGTKLRALGPTSETLSTQTTAPHQLWRQVRYSQDGIGWVRASSVLLL